MQNAFFSLKSQTLGLEQTVWADTLDDLSAFVWDWNLNLGRKESAYGLRPSAFVGVSLIGILEDSFVEC